METLGRCGVCKCFGQVSEFPKEIKVDDSKICAECLKELLEAYSLMNPKKFELIKKLVKRVA